MEQLIVELGLGIAIGSIGFLLKRAIQSLDVTLQEIVQTIHGTANGENTGLKSRVMVLEEKAADQEEQTRKVTETLEVLRSQIQREAVKNAENFGEVKTDIREVLTAVKEIRRQGSSK